MGTHTPNLDQAGKEKYIGSHLFNELRWLLGAATEWFLQDQLKLDIVGYNVQVYAMDSAFLHARALFEFFGQSTNKNHYGSDMFLGVGTILKSSNYTNDWKGPLHKSLMHAQDRSCPTPLKSSGVDKDLNKMPVDFALEILKLWGEFERKLCGSSAQEDQRLGKLAREKRKEAIKAAECVVESTVARQHARDKSQILKPVFIFTE